MLRATTDQTVHIISYVVGLAAVLNVYRRGASGTGKIVGLVAAAVAGFLLWNLDAKFWGVVVMGGAVLILFFLPWLDRSPVKSIRYRPGWHLALYIAFVAYFLVLGYFGIQPPSPFGQKVSMIGVFAYFGFFLLMPWWSQQGTFKPVPDRVTFEAH
jgi:ubiquinol-cytochrome c reductase cytochrome b subunit